MCRRAVNGLLADLRWCSRSRGLLKVGKDLPSLEMGLAQVSRAPFFRRAGESRSPRDVLVASLHRIWGPLGFSAFALRNLGSPTFSLVLGLSLPH